MAFAVIPDYSERTMADRIFEDASAVEVFLYNNVETPDQDSVLEDFDEVAYPGYAAQPVAWAGGTATVGHKATWGADTVTFTGPTDATPVSVEGWGVKATWAFGTRLVMAAKFDESRVLSDDTDELKLVIEMRAFDFHQP